MKLISVGTIFYVACANKFSIISATWYFFIGANMYRVFSKMHPISLDPPESAKNEILSKSGAPHGVYRLQAVNSSKQPNELHHTLFRAKTIKLGTNKLGRIRTAIRFWHVHRVQRRLILDLWIVGSFVRNEQVLCWCKFPRKHSRVMSLRKPANI